MTHVNDKKNQRKNRMMERRLARGILEPGESNSGSPDSSKLHPKCKWAKTYLKKLQAA